MWEMDKIIGEMAKAFDKGLTFVGTDLEIWKMVKIFGKWIRCILQGLSI